MKIKGMIGQQIGSGLKDGNIHFELPIIFVCNAEQFATMIKASVVGTIDFEVKEV